MSDNHYNKYSNEFQPPSHYQVKANVTTNNGTNQQFSYGVNPGVPTQQPGGYESNTHLSSLSNCVKRLQTQLNQYLTKIIDEGSDGPTNYNLGSGEVLNSHLMEQYSSGGGGGSGPLPPNPTGIGSGNPYAQMGGNDPSINNGYSYYSNYPASYPSYPTVAPTQAPSSYHPHHHPAATSAATAVDYYNHHQQQQHPQYSNFQEPKSKKTKK